MALLQVAQARRVRRGDVDREIARDRRKGLDQRDIVADAVGRILVGADIDADDAGKLRARRKSSKHGLGAVIVEAHAVDHGLVALEAEQPRPRIAALRLRRHRADLDKAEAEPQQRVRHLGVLVEARGHADRIGEIEAEGAHRELAVVGAQFGRRQEFQAGMARRCASSASIQRSRGSERASKARITVSAPGSHASRRRAYQILHAPHRAEIEFAIEMRKQLVIARTLPAQRAAERIGVDLDQEQRVLAGEEFRAVSATCAAAEK